MSKCRYCKKELPDGSDCKNPACMAKSFLGEYEKMINIVKRHKRTLSQIKYEFYHLKGIDYSRVKVSGGRKNDEMLNYVCRMEKVEEDISKKLIKAREYAVEIEKYIDKLPYPYNELLYKRYIEFKRFEKIAIEMQYSFRQILRLHDAGLELFYEKK